jgi:cysteine synthase A
MATPTSESILDLIGNTPLVYLRGLSEETGHRIFGKCEHLNPGGSVKDRTALGIVEAAEARGDLKPGGTVVERTAGNTAIGLALVCAAKRYRSIFVIPDTMTKDKIDTVRAFGVDVRLVPKRGWTEPDHYAQVARRIGEEVPGAFFADQFNNPDNVSMHYRTTGPEIWEQTEGRVDLFITGMGTAGTLCGAGRYLKERNPQVKVVCSDPGGSVYYRFFHDRKEETERTSSIQGVGIGKIPGCYDGGIIDDVIRVGDEIALPMAHRLTREEGLFVGGSSGLSVGGALAYLAREQPSRPWTVVTVLCDSGGRYLSQMFDPDWLRAQGFRELAG